MTAMARAAGDGGACGAATGHDESLGRILTARLPAIRVAASYSETDG